MALHDNVFYRVMQQTLTKAYPSVLPSNQVLNQFANPMDTVNFPDQVSTTLTQLGYPYGWGEWVQLSGAGTNNLTHRFGSILSSSIESRTLCGLRPFDSFRRQLDLSE
ncbi:hypothetical protein NZD89_06940 [Alicyclobacillus fastidiosus]|uniref:Uncharacterized protein n=1 Tax=Alicyclobacillus fastidiosus TaxID=392011 RepID=A0ABY6ZPI0_9BACL|nr:hypothetical protein [Alicyclobacillus fastidiosus]WAH44770.1 hypothetical protein NZD89_06940 [Alicyclobacillus fastidiosus]GMA65138.1 hypothetical protein GCM10025859_55780 [Alicyclobacillus fastidiosus]